MELRTYVTETIKIHCLQSVACILSFFSRTRDKVSPTWLRGMRTFTKEIFRKDTRVLGNRNERSNLTAHADRERVEAPSRIPCISSERKFYVRSISLHLPSPCHRVDAPRIICTFHHEWHLASPHPLRRNSQWASILCKQASLGCKRENRQWRVRRFRSEARVETTKILRDEASLSVFVFVSFSLRVGTHTWKYLVACFWKKVELYLTRMFNVTKCGLF